MVKIWLHGVDFLCWDCKAFARAETLWIYSTSNGLLTINVVVVGKWCLGLSITCQCFFPIPLISMQTKNLNADT